MNNDELLIAIKDMFDKKVNEMNQHVDEVKQQAEVLLEKMQGDIKAIAEGHSILDRKIDSLDRKVSSLDGKVNSLDMKVNSLDMKVNSLDMKVNSLDRKIDSIDGKVNSLSRELDETKNELKKEITVIKDYVIGVDAKLNEHEVILKRVK